MPDRVNLLANLHANSKKNNFQAEERTVGRKTKVTGTTTNLEIGKLQPPLGIPADEKDRLFREDGKVIHFQNPKVQASRVENTYLVSSGQVDNKNLTDLLPISDDGKNKMKTNHTGVLFWVSVVFFVFFKTAKLPILK